jgi:hypothetical protein
MNRFHLFIIENFYLWSLCPKGTPLLERLIFATQISSFLIFIMTISRLLTKIVPFDCTIAVTRYIVFSFFGFPFESSTWITGHSRSVPNCNDFTLINVIDSDLSVRTWGTYMFIVRADFQWKYFCVNVAEKIHESWPVWRKIFMIEFKDSRAKFFLLNFMRCMLEQVVPFLLCDFLFDDRCGHFDFCS